MGPLEAINAVYFNRIQAIDGPAEREEFIVAAVLAVFATLSTAPSDEYARWRQARLAALRRTARD